MGGYSENLASQPNNDAELPSGEKAARFEREVVPLHEVLYQHALHMCHNHADAANFADRPPCRRKHRRPPSAEALAEADRVRGKDQALQGQQVIADFARYAAAARPIRATRHDGGEAR
jgi:hypothetical protein